VLLEHLFCLISRGVGGVFNFDFLFFLGILIGMQLSILLHFLNFFFREAAGCGYSYLLLLAGALVLGAHA